MGKVQWRTVVKMVAGAPNMQAKAEEVADLVRDVWRACAVSLLVQEAKQFIRQEELKAERQAMLAERGLTAKEWKQWSDEKEIKDREEVGLPANADATSLLAARLKKIVRTYTGEMRIQWSSELLASTFALEDGTKVPWGEATLDQHRERLRMFTDLAGSNIEGAARHQAAIDALVKSGSACLNEMCLSAA